MALLIYGVQPVSVCWKERHVIGAVLFCKLYTDVLRVSVGLQSGLVQNRVGGLTQIAPCSIFSAGDSKGSNTGKR